MEPFVEEKYSAYFTNNLPYFNGTSSSTILSAYKWLLGGKSPFFSETEKRRWLRERNSTYDQWLDSLQHIDYDDITLGFKDLLTNFYIRYPTSSDGLNLSSQATQLLC